MSRIVIEPGTENSNYWKDIWNYRGLFYFLAWRDILVRYKQTAIGVLWSVIRPLLTIFVMWFIGWLFGSNVPEGVPRILLVCAATLPWQFFSSSFSESSNSLIANSNLLTKVYFPRLIVPVLAQTNMKKIKNINPLGFFDDEFLLEMFTKPGYPLQKLVYMKCPKT